MVSSQPTDAPEPDPEHERQSHSARTWLSLRGSGFARCHALMPIHRSTTPARFGPLCAACRLANYAAGPPMRLVYEHIKAIHPYLDVGFGISGGDPRASKRSSKALKRQRCPLWRARQRTCAGGFHVCENVTPRSSIHWIDTTIPASSAMNVAQAIVHHKSSAFTLTHPNWKLESLTV